MDVNTIKAWASRKGAGDPGFDDGGLPMDAAAPAPVEGMGEEIAEEPIAQSPKEALAAFAETLAALGDQAALVDQLRTAGLEDEAGKVEAAAQTLADTAAELEAAAADIEEEVEEDEGEGGEEEMAEGGDEYTE